MYFSNHVNALAVVLLTIGSSIGAVPTADLNVAHDTNFDDFDPSTHASNKYIVTLHEGANVVKHMDYVQDLHATALTKRQDGKLFEGVIHHYNDIPGFRGYAGEFDSTVVEKLKRHRDVLAVERDQIFDDDSIKTQANPTWNLAQISHRGPATSRDGYMYDWRGGMYDEVYVLDSGIMADHSDFTAQAMMKRGFFCGGKDFNDNTGHGTMIAGIVGGNKWGVAKHAKMIDVKVMDGKTGKDSDVLAGLNWSVKEILGKRYQRNSIILLSLGAQSSRSMNNAIRSAAGKGVTIVAAAGDEGKVGRWTKSAIVVGASGHMRERAKFSNYGPGITLFAPGEDIESSYTGDTRWGKGNFKTSTGTSQAAAHVAGVVALLKSKDKSLVDAKKTKDALVKLATPNVVNDTKGSPNLFLYNGSGK
ncbi:subtilisin-like protein [Myriangium duriaei CBS 260.36]|uniref:Subtilisin-like protein n=1 Tax=Myriangium duriaei CBS 260.36 TaxID=1168546 RepID=A0A9P4JCR8_9PEZI|nr:subtilisin-like protein [Myriangium duriaei CBS 260.36]